MNQLILYAIIFVLISLQLKAENQDSLSHRKLHYGLNFSVQRTDNFLSKEAYYESLNMRRARVFLEMSAYTYNAGFNLYYNWLKQFGFESGLGFFTYKYKRYIEKGSRETFLPAVREINSELSYQFINLPLVMQYQIRLNKASFYLGAGLLNHFFLTKKIKGDSEQAFVETVFPEKHFVRCQVCEESHKLYSYSGIAKLGFTYPIFKQYRMFLEINYQRMLKPFRNLKYKNSQIYYNYDGSLSYGAIEEDLDESLYAFGFSIGFIY